MEFCVFVWEKEEEEQGIFWDHSSTTFCQLCDSTWNTDEDGGGHVRRTTLPRCVRVLPRNLGGSSTMAATATSTFFFLYQTRYTLRRRPVVKCLSGIGKCQGARTGTGDSMLTNSHCFFCGFGGFFFFSVWVYLADFLVRHARLIDGLMCVCVCGFRKIGVIARFGRIRGRVFDWRKG